MDPTGPPCRKECTPMNDVDILKFAIDAVAEVNCYRGGQFLEFVRGRQMIRHPQLISENLRHRINGGGSRR